MAVETPTWTYKSEGDKQSASEMNELAQAVIINAAELSNAKYNIKNLSSDITNVDNRITSIEESESEDIITKVNDTKQVSSYLADKQYNEANYSGLGRIYLRKNIQTIIDPSTGAVINVNLLTQSMLAKENTTYIIQYDYNLNRQTISMPGGSVLLFKGGSIDDGTINCNSTTIVDKFSGNATIIGTYSFQDAQADEEDITQNQSSVLKFKDRKYEPDMYSGLGRVILRKNIVEIDDTTYGKIKKNVLYQDMINKENTIYEIRYDFDLNGAEITIPEGCALDFQGGSLSNGSLIGRNTHILASENAFIFKNNLNIIGIWSNNNIYVTWLGAENSLTSNYELINKDSSRAIQQAFNIICEKGFETVYFPKNLYYIENTININVLKNIKFEGEASGDTLSYLQTTKCPVLCAMLYTNKDISLFNIDINYPKYQSSIGSRYAMSIDGGQLDVSLCVQSYHSPVINFTDNNKNSTYWGLNIVTAIIGHNTLPRVSSNSVAINFNFNNGGYATMIRTKCLIGGLHYGIKDNLSNGSWITDIEDTSVISARCAIHLDKSFKTRLSGSYQCVSVFPNGEDGDGMIELNSSDHIIDGVIWDVNNLVGDSHTNRYAVIIGEDAESIIFEGASRDLYKRYLVKGYSSEYEVFDNHADVLIGKPVNVVYDGNVVAVNNIDNITKTSGSSSININFNNTEYGSCEYTIDCELLNYKAIKVITTRIKGFQIGFKNITVMLYNNDTIVFNKTLNIKSYKNPNIQYCTNIFNIPYGSSYGNKIKIKFSEPIQGINSQNLFEILRVQANQFRDTASYITKDGRGATVLYDNRDVPQIFWGTARTLSDIAAQRTLGRDIMAITTKGVHFYNANGWGIPVLQDPEITVQGGYEMPSQIPASPSRPTLYEDLSKHRTYFYRAEIGWQEYDSCKAGILRAGVFSQKPNAGNIYIGFAYFCTDRSTTEGATNGIMIYHKGNNVWVDALGRVVS